MPDADKTETEAEKDAAGAAAAAAAATAPPTASDDGGQPPTTTGDGAASGGGKNVTLSSRAFQARLQEERGRAQRAATADLEKKAKDAGFASLDAMFARVAGGGSNTNTQPPKPKEDDGDGGDGGNGKLTRQDRKELARSNREIDRLRKAVDEAQRKARTEEKQRKDVLRKMDALEARSELEKAALLAGVKDVDYAVTLLQRALDGKSEDELKGFDEKKFFENLRSTNSYLFGEIVKPANTGVGTSGAPNAPKPDAATKDNAAAGQVDATKMKQDELAARLKKWGIDPNSLPA